MTNQENSCIILAINLLFWEFDLFHQADNSIGGEIYNAFIYRNTEWKNHIHKAFEFVLALSGKIEERFGHPGGFP